MICIKEIPFQDTFPVRHVVLREGKPIESCFFEGDDLETTQHFGLYLDKKVVAVVSLFKKNNAIFIENNQFQIRGMAVLKETQKSGFGKILLSHCEAELSKQKEVILWFNARINAVPFYEKSGYTKKGTSFEIKDIGLHHLMFKKID